MPLEPEFLADCPYSPEGLLLDDILSVDKETGRVVAQMTVHERLPLTQFQRVHPTRHPRHVSGGLMVHMTGMLGFVHAYYVLGLRHHEGWIGYGAKIHHARFHNLADMNSPVILAGWPTLTRKSGHRILARYSFEFKQGEKLVYEGDQTAMWLNVDQAPPEPMP